MQIPILKQGRTLIVTFQADPLDQDLKNLSYELAQRIGEVRARAVILDTDKLDIIDSYCIGVLRNIAITSRLRGAMTVIVGIQSEVAMAMVQLGIVLDDIHMALDLEDGLEFLERYFRAKESREN